MRYFGAGAGGSGQKSENRAQDLNPKKRNVRREQLILKTYSATLISFGWLVRVVFSETTDTWNTYSWKQVTTPYAASSKAATQQLLQNPSQAACSYCALGSLPHVELVARYV